ncbi:hypothetical protein BY996DRAFT_8078340 [Phakopsora pachyrhizi]|nr:hypothetical protein BY996DRAFT_8078340 [Phakopsora pachyrhizi]
MFSENNNDNERLYMAPEILRYEKYDAKADLWSVGAVLFEMSVGKPPFRAQNHVELLRKIEKSEDRIVFPNDKFVAEDIKNLIKCLLKQNPSERISFKEFFELADQVSSHGLLANPPAVNDSSSKPTQTLRNRLISNLAPRPPSLSTLPNPISPKQKTNPPPISPNRFEGEQGAFLVGNKTPSTINRSNSLKLINQPLTPDNSKTNKHNLNNPGQQAPSPSNLPNPLPPANYRPTNVLSFPAKYVTVGAGKQITITSSNQVPSVSTEIKTKDYALVPANQSKNNRMYADSNTTLDKTEGEDRDLGTEYVVVEKGSVEINALVDAALSSSPRQAMSLGRRMSRGFMSSKPNLTSLNLSPHLNSSSSPPPPSSLITTTGYQPYASPNSSFPPRVHTLPSPPASTGAHPMMITNFGRSSPSTTALHNNYSSSPRSFDSNGGGGIGSLPIVGKYFPQSNQAQSPGSNRATFNQSSKSRPSFSFPSNRLSLAILRKQNQNPSTTAGSSHQLDRVENQLIEEFESLGCKILVICEYADEKLSKLLPPLPSSTSTSSRPTIESNSHNSFIGAFVSATPSGTQNQLNSQDRLCGELGSGVVEMNSNNEGDDQDLLAHEAMVLYLCVLKFLDRAIRHGAQVLDWKKSTSSNFNSSSNNNNLVNGRLGFSPEVGIAIEWMRNKFNEVFDKVEFVKTKSNNHYESNNNKKSNLPRGKLKISTRRNSKEYEEEEEIDDKNEKEEDRYRVGMIYAEKLIYDRALEKSRSAAVNELMGDNLKESEIEYESSLNMMYSLLEAKQQTNQRRRELRRRRRRRRRRKSDSNGESDEDVDDFDVEGRGEIDDNDYDEEDEDDDHDEDEDEEVIEKFIESIRARLSALRRKM